MALNNFALASSSFVKELSSFVKALRSFVMVQRMCPLELTELLTETTTQLQGPALVYLSLPME